MPPKSNGFAFSSEDLSVNFEAGIFNVTTELPVKVIVNGVEMGVLANDASKTNTAFVEQVKKPDQIGYIDEDGWRYEGISETTGERLWSAEKDSGIMTYYNAIKYTQELKDFQGYDGSKITSRGNYKSIEERLKKEDDGGARLATRAELNQMYQNQKTGLCDNNFDSTDPDYWSLSEYDDDNAHFQRFTGGRQYVCNKHSTAQSASFGANPC
jgi:hypothetical protein